MHLNVFVLFFSSLFCHHLCVFRGSAIIRGFLFYMHHHGCDKSINVIKCINWQRSYEKKGSKAQRIYWHLMVYI